MKKMISLIVVLVAIVAGTTNLNAVTVESTNETAVLNVNDAPVYWSGTAGWPSVPQRRLTIKVYQSPGSCNSYYAKVTDADKDKDAIGETLVVKSGSRSGSYYVTWGGRDYYFYM